VDFIFIPSSIMNILLAPNAFKNSLSAREVSQSIENGFLQSGLDCRIQSFPIGDGGDGTGRLIIEKLSGFLEEVQAKDPLGRTIKTSIGFIDTGTTAVIEMADISGLRLLSDSQRDPLQTSSQGTGQLIRIALDRDVQKIILCVGGSATVDGGCGILQELGVRFLDEAAQDLMRLPSQLTQLNAIDITLLDKRILDTELVVLCDVDNFLLGKNGAAAVFGPQKGASHKDVLLLEAGMHKFRDIWLLQTGRDLNQIVFGGAAGGVAASLHSFLRAKLVQGIEYFLDLTEFNEALHDTDLLITAEGSIDRQTLQGKGPFGVARRAKKNNIPVIGIAGQIPLLPDTGLQEYFDVLIPIGHQPEDLKTSMEHTSENLARTAFQLGKWMSLGLTGRPVFPDIKTENK
jgi:glycerate 2-kinase